MNALKTIAASALALWALASSPLALARGEPSNHGHHDEADHDASEQKTWGTKGNSAQVTRTIDITLGDDMRFVPARLDLREGETVRLRLHNTGKVKHEFVLGTQRSLDKHAELMRRFPGMEHDEPYAEDVDPGDSEEIIWTFNRPGRFAFACLIAGHYEAGMRGTVTVRPVGAAKAAS